MAGIVGAIHTPKHRLAISRVSWFLCFNRKMAQIAIIKERERKKGHYHNSENQLSVLNCVIFVDIFIRQIFFCDLSSSF